ncbi:hypothetical protein [Serratia fonticola]|uniref:hypothetical protein n=1 Tax=Serratia fonticola TaxID=47917 RepID=UPI0016490067|nr:hypothetical protein [Serratia fonticola]MBC3216694.1 hypothetical protein [Serratia fonticola]
MIHTPNIILIDDEEPQLNIIQQAFFSAGIPCLPILYNCDFVENKSGIDHVELGMFNPRIVVTDLNLRNGSLNEPKELAKPIVDLLKKINIDGPFILIFWSRIADEVNQVMDLVQERFYDETPLPIYYTSIDKTQYLGGDNKENLKGKVKSIIGESDIFNALLDWESRISQAARETTNSLYKITKPTELQQRKYQDLHTEKLQEVLVSIGNASLGVKNAKREPEIALDLGLAPVLHDHLSTISIGKNSGIWKKAVPKIGTKIDLNDSLKTKLNSFYHIEQVIKDYPKSCRGAFLELSKDILDDGDKQNKLEARLGQDIEGIITDEFLSQIVKPDKMEMIRASTILGFIEVSAECDQAQQKTKLHRYILAALTPIVHGDYVLYGKSKTSHQGIYKLPDVCINGVDYILQATFKYQIGSMPDENKWFGDVKFRLRDQVMSELVFNCAHYISRPGIICFK